VLFSMFSEQGAETVSFSNDVFGSAGVTTKPLLLSVSLLRLSLPLSTRSSVAAVQPTLCSPLVSTPPTSLPRENETGVF
jgi:hypothetical protein